MNGWETLDDLYEMDEPDYWRDKLIALEEQNKKKDELIEDLIAEYRTEPLEKAGTGPFTLVPKSLIERFIKLVGEPQIDTDSKQIDTA